MRKILTTVFVVHMAALLYFVISADLQKPKKKPLQVKTMVAAKISPPQRAQSQPSTPICAKPKAPSPPPAPIPNSAPPQTPAVVKPKVASKKKEIPKPAPIKKSGAPQKKGTPPSNVSHLLQELEETIAKIDQKRDKGSPLKQIEPPKWMGALKIDAIKEISDDNIEVDFAYHDTLIHILKRSLDLPELGEVKIELTLSRDGTVATLRVLHAESEKNRGYLEKNLSTLKFPPLEMHENRKTFVLTFCNE